MIGRDTQESSPTAENTLALKYLELLNGKFTKSVEIKP